MSHQKLIRGIHYTQARKRVKRDPPRHLNPRQMSPDVQNRGQWSHRKDQTKQKHAWKHCSSGVLEGIMILLISASEIPRCRAKDGSMWYMIHLDIWLRSLSSRMSSSSYRRTDLDQPPSVAISDSGDQEI